MPSKGRTADFAKMADLVGVQKRISASRPEGMHGARLLVGHDPDCYHGRDRHAVAPVDGPANVGELLRGAGYWIPRHPLMDGWAEAQVARGATELSQAPEEARGEVLAQIRTRLGSGARKLAERGYAGQEALLQAHMLWVLEDLIDRAEILLWHAAQARALVSGPPWTLTTAATSANTDSLS